MTFVKVAYLKRSKKLSKHQFKIMVEESKNSYEEILDKTTKSIEKFIENAENDKKENIQ